MVRPSPKSIHLAKHLLNALPARCQLILVGDADQLPSVGPGSVLYELLASGAVPAVKLDKETQPFWMRIW